MSEPRTPPDLTAYVQAAAALVDMPIPAASLPIVVAQMELAAHMARLLEGFALDMREDPAPTFDPGAQS